MDCLQCLITQTLYSERNTIDSVIKQSYYILTCDVLGIAFEGYLAPTLSSRRGCLKTFENRSYFIQCENRRGSSSEIDCIDFHHGERIIAIWRTTRIVFFFLDCFVPRNDGYKIFPNFLLQILDISSFFQLSKNRCQCEFAIWTLLSTKWDVEVEVQEATMNGG